MRILFADKFPESQMQELRRLDHFCEYEPDLGADDLAGRIAGFDALVVRSTKVEPDAISAADCLKLVIRAGAGTNTIDKSYAASRQIAVCNVPGKNAIAVAELTIGLLISIDRNIPDNVHELRAGKWNKKTYSSAKGLYGRTMGIVGAGAIGIAVAERAHALGLKLHMIEKPGRSEETVEKLRSLSVTGVSNLDEIAQRCEIVSFHVPAADSTRHLVNANFLSRLCQGAIVLNTSRGDVVDEQALIQAMDAKSIRAGLDVYDSEPGASAGDFASPLAMHPGVYGTHHIGASTQQAQTAVAEGVIDIVEAFGRGELLNRVN